MTASKLDHKNLELLSEFDGKPVYLNWCDMRPPESVKAASFWITSERSREERMRYIHERSAPSEFRTQWAGVCWSSHSLVPDIVSNVFGTSWTKTCAQLRRIAISVCQRTK